MEIIHNGKTIRILKKTGEIIGEMSLISKEVRSASVRAVEKLRCLSIDASFFDEFKASSHNILYYIFSHILARRLKTVNQELSNAKKENELLKKTTS